jgi:hypothetical protein
MEFRRSSSKNQGKIGLEQELITPENLLGWGGKFLGTLMTLPSILAFLRDRRGRKEKEFEDKVTRVIQA